MASYADLRALFDHGPLRNQVEVALIDIAQEVLADDPASPDYAARLAYAVAVLEAPEAEARTVMRSVLVQNKAAAAAAITGATDNAVRTAVAAVFPVLAVARFGGAA